MLFRSMPLYLSVLHCNSILGQIRKNHPLRKTLLGIIQKKTMGETQESRTIFDVKDPIENMSREQLAAECQNWRNLSEYIPEEYKFWLAKIGQPVIIFKRTGGYLDGVYHGARLEVTKHEIKSFERIRSQIEKRYFIHDTITLIPESNVTDFKFVQTKYEDTPDPWATPDPEQQVNEKLATVNEIENDGINQDGP